MNKSRTFTKGDLGNPFAINVVSGDNSTYDLTGATASFFMGSAECVGSANVVYGIACSIPTGSDGRIQYYWASGDLATAGNFKAKIKITKADTRVIWAPFGDDAAVGFPIMIVDNYE